MVKRCLLKVTFWHCNMWANGDYRAKFWLDDPPVMVSVTDVIVRMTNDFNEAIRRVQRNQTQLMQEQRKLATRARVRTRVIVLPK